MLTGSVEKSQRKHGRVPSVLQIGITGTNRGKADFNATAELNSTFDVGQRIDLLFEFVSTGGSLPSSATVR
jgi:hypothetical protein